MAKPSDIRDPDPQTALEDADRLLSDGKYVESVRRSVQAYTRLMESRPELIVRPPPGQTNARLTVGQVAAPSAPGTPAVGQLVGAGRGWPSLLGVRMSFDEQNNPRLTFEKERFSMSEAATYFEFALDQIAKAQAIEG